MGDRRGGCELSSARKSQIRVLFGTKSAWGGVGATPLLRACGIFFLQAAVFTHVKGHFSVPTRAPQVAFAPPSQPVIQILKRSLVISKGAFSPTGFNDL